MNTAQKIVLIMNARMPTEKAHGYAIAKMCEALSKQGAGVELIIPTRCNTIDQDIFDYYSLPHTFSVRSVSCFDFVSRAPWLGRFALYAQSISFLLALKRQSVARDANIITRSADIAWWYTRQGYKVFFDAHNFPSHHTKIFAALLKKVAGVIANSKGTEEAYRRTGIKRILVVPNAVDLALFDRAIPCTHHDLGVAEGQCIAMYIGHLYGWKGVDVVIEAARQNTDHKLTFVFVGGVDKDIERYRSITNGMKNVVFLGHRTRDEVPSIAKAADVLLLPNVPSTKESLSYTSPIKMFEYMASGVPIVASDLPSIREILNEQNATLVKASDPDALFHGIEQSSTSAARVKASRAYEEVKNYTWDARAGKVLAFLDK